MEDSGQIKYKQLHYKHMKETKISHNYIYE